jgi:hypothetical protein
MSVGSISGSSSSSYLLLSQISSSSSIQSASSTGTMDGSSGPDFTEALEAVGVDSETADTLQEEIQSAVSAAIAYAQESGDTTDLREVIKSAIDETLEANGLDPAEVMSQMAPPQGGEGGMSAEGMGGMAPPPPPPEESSTESDTTSTLLSDTTDSSETESTTESDTTTDATLTELMESIQELLTQLGSSQGASGIMVGFLFDAQG